MTTGKSLTGSTGVRKLQTMLHVKAKEEPKRRFHALIDKVWRADFLAEAWVRVRNGPRELDSAVSEIFLGFQAAKSR